MLEQPPTFEEIWRARIGAIVLAFFTLMGLIWVQWRVLRLNFLAGTGLAPIWNFLAFQALSKILTKRAFQFRLDPRAKTTEQVFDLVFTVAFGFSLLVGIGAAYDAWTYQAPTL